MNRSPSRCEWFGVRRSRALLCFALAAPIGFAPSALAAPKPAQTVGASPLAEGSPEYLAQRKRVIELERALNKIRVKHFGSVRVADIRHEGVEKMHDAVFSFIQVSVASTGLPADEVAADAYPILLDVFDREAEDVRVAALDIMASRPSAPSDAALAWVACFDENPQMRGEALARLAPRAGELGDGAKSAIAHALRSGDAVQATAAANAVQAMHILEAIPMLISAQVSPQGRAPQRSGPKAFIYVGTQRHFVSDVTPVVGTSSVAFDPTVSVLNTGALLVIHDSLVTSYRSEVHDVLVAMTSGAIGRSTEYLGYDLEGWASWWGAQGKQVLLARSAEPAPASKPGAPVTPAPAAPSAPEVILVPTPDSYWRRGWVACPGLPFLPMPIPIAPGP